MSLKTFSESKLIYYNLLHCERFEDDILFCLRWPSNFFMRNDVMKHVTRFIFGYLSLEFLVDFVIVAVDLSNFKDNCWQKYSAVVLGSFSIFISYVNLFVNQKKLSSLFSTVMPKLWSVQATGPTNYNYLKREAKYVYYCMIILIVLTNLASVIACPWFGDEYDIYLPVKIYVDYFGKYAPPFLFLFYATIFQFGLIIISNIFDLSYALLHLKFQCFLLNENLVRIKHKTAKVDIDNCPFLNDYHSQIRQDLIVCDNQLELIKKFANDINKLFYWPILTFTICGITTGVSLILFLKIFINQNLMKWLFITINTTLITLGMIFIAQSLENESEKLFFSISDLPWYLWNPHNKKIVMIMLTKTQKPISMSCSGLVTVNYRLLIAMFQRLYSAASVIINM